MSKGLVARCVLGIALLGACGDDGGSGPAWAVVAENQPAALLSAWSSGPTDVWVVGGDPRDGTGPIALHYDGAKWIKIDTGQRNVDLWWVFGFAGGPVFMSGSNGTILRYQNGMFQKQDTTGLGTSIVFGMWGATPDDLWAVGGNFGNGGFVWRNNTGGWALATGVPSDITLQGTCWKVNGRAADDLWISATRGTTLHWNGATLDRTDVPIDASLLSVAGNSKRFVTVGGAFDGVLFEDDGGGWKSALPAGGPALNGVAMSEDQAYAVGQFGTVLARDGGGGWSSEKPRMTDQSLHAVWIDPGGGGVWAVGGKFDTSPTRTGVLLHKGEPVPSP